MTKSAIETVLYLYSEASYSVRTGDTNHVTVRLEDSFFRLVAYDPEVLEAFAETCQAAALELRLARSERETAEVTA